jgi:hypothetical protein
MRLARYPLHFFFCTGVLVRWVQIHIMMRGRTKFTANEKGHLDDMTKSICGVIY